MEVEDISDSVLSSSDNVSSAAEPSLANASSSRQTATTPPTSPACFASTNGEPSGTTAAHIRDTDTCTDDVHGTARRRASLLKHSWMMTRVVMSTM